MFLSLPYQRPIVASHRVGKPSDTSNMSVLSGFQWFSLSIDALSSRVGGAVAAGLILAAVLSGCTGIADPSLPASESQVAPGPIGPEDMDSRRQIWMVPSSRQGLLMRATLVRPAGQGPFRLVVVNHGSEQDAAQRSLMPMPAFKSISEWFLQHGYAVLTPQRPGHGETGGPYLEDQGACGSANYAKAGDATADSIAAAIDFMVRQPFIKPDGVVVVGNSAGGWGAIALAGRNPAGVAAVVNFAGGRGGRDYNRPGRNCSPERLLAAAAEYGKTARVPTLWLYASNDTYFPPALSKQMAEAFRKGGGPVDYRLLPAVGRDGHALANAPAAIWGAHLEQFLASHS
jgi:dienelactone hydrolase